MGAAGTGAYQLRLAAARPMLGMPVRAIFAEHVELAGAGHGQQGRVVRASAATRLARAGLERPELTRKINPERPSLGRAERNGRLLQSMHQMAVNNFLAQAMAAMPFPFFFRSSRLHRFR